MKRLCFGTVYKILFLTRANGIKDVQLCESIFKSFECDYSLDSTKVGHLKSGKDGVPIDLINSARSCDNEELIKNFHNDVITKLNQNNYKTIINAIKDIIANDKNIEDNTNIGFGVEYSKKNILSKNKFEIATLLAAVYKYVIIEVNNTSCFKEIKKITPSYIEEMQNTKNRVYLDNYDDVGTTKTKTPLLTTLKDETFSSVFEKVTKKVISNISKQSTISIYKLDLQNKRFRFNDLKNFILENIDSYVSSRSQIKDNQNSNKLVINAFKKFAKYSNLNKDTILGELLIYAFLEKELNAPKIMTKIELDEKAIQSKSDGVHLLSIKGNDVITYQTVLGASNIIDDLHVAVDLAINKIINICKNEFVEFSIVDNSIYKHIYDESTKEYIKNKIVPKRGKSIRDNAFGIFLGYTIALDVNIPNEKFIEAVNKKMQTDIKEIEKYIISKIKDNKLDGYSFYVYIIPFNEAKEEKVNIINNIIEECE